MKIQFIKFAQYIKLYLYTIPDECSLFSLHENGTLILKRITELYNFQGTLSKFATLKEQNFNNMF